MTIHRLPRILLALLAALLVTAAVPALAQGPFGGGPGHGPGAGVGPGPGAAAGPAAGPTNGRGFARLADYLELTDEQIAAAQEIFEANRDAAEPLRDEHLALREELMALLDGDAPDPQAVGELAIALHDGRETLRGLREDAWDDFKALLTADQLDKLEELGEVRRHFGPGPGGGPGDGPGPFGPGRGAGSGLGPCAS